MVHGPRWEVQPQDLLADRKPLLSTGSIFAFGVMVENVLVGLLEFVSPGPKPVDPDLVELATPMGAQVGRVIERAKARESEAQHREAVGTSGPLPADPQDATIVSMSTQSLREVRDSFSEVVDRVEREHERVTVTRNGRAAAVILSPEDLAELEETLDVLSDPDTLADIREADAAYRRGDVVRGADAVHGLRT